MNILVVGTEGFLSDSFFERHYVTVGGPHVSKSSCLDVWHQLDITSIISTTNFVSSLTLAGDKFDAIVCCFEVETDENVSGIIKTRFLIDSLVSNPLTMIQMLYMNNLVRPGCRFISYTDGRFNDNYRSIFEQAAKFVLDIMFVSVNSEDTLNSVLGE